MHPPRNDAGAPPTPNGSLLSRRPLLASLAGTILLGSPPVLAHGPNGPVKPALTVPDIEIVASDGFRGRLGDRLIGHVTAIQLMFTTCRSICPIEAATFVRVQEALAACDCGDIHLLSLSIDPLTDTPEVLKAWLDGFGAGPAWTAVAPAKPDLERARTFFDRTSSIGEDHSTAMNLINRSGQLTWRTSELPVPTEVVKILSYLQRTATTSAP